MLIQDSIAEVLPTAGPRDGIAAVSPLATGCLVSSPRRDSRAPVSGSRCTRKTGWNRASEPPWFPATSAVTEETRKGMSSVTIIRVQPRPVRELREAIEDDKAKAKVKAKVEKDKWWELDSSSD